MCDVCRRLSLLINDSDIKPHFVESQSVAQRIVTEISAALKRKPEISAESRHNGELLIDKNVFDLISKSFGIYFVNMTTCMQSNDDETFCKLSYGCEAEQGGSQHPTKMSTFLFPQLPQ